MISRDKAYDLAYRLRNTYIIVPKSEIKPVKISAPIEPVEAMRYTSPIFNEAADVIEELTDALIDVCMENSAFEAANEMQKEKLVKYEQRILRLIRQRDECIKQFDLLCKKMERAEHCINEISDQFERGKCSNDYVEEFLKEYYENE